MLAWKNIAQTKPVTHQEWISNITYN
jgi:hypothetical protein